MTQREAEKEYDRLGHLIDSDVLKVDEYESDIDTLRDEIKDITQEISELTKEMRNKSNQIVNLRSKMTEINLRIKHNTKLQQKIENEFDV